MKKIYIKNHPPSHGAGFWIYRGYESAWKSLGYEVEFFDNLEEIRDEGCDIMTTDATANLSNIDILKKANRVYLYVQPTSFPDPWGRHPNFQSLCAQETRDILNAQDNVFQWTFGEVTDYHTLWNNPSTIPLAYDNLNYNKNIDNKVDYDVCFIGGVANNGFNEKISIMVDHLKAFKQEHDKTGIKCGFFVGQNLSHIQEEKVISSSKVCINIHDAYQRELGLDTNERTFKTLGLNGILVSDQVTQLNTLFPDVPTSSDPEQMVSLVKEVMSYSDDKLNKIREKNIENILSNHTYLSRAKYMEKL
jgi:hypothetical protein